MRGGSLADVLAARGGTLSEAEAKIVAFCILSGLQDMHAGGYCHLDVKPDNVGVAQEGDLATVALMDFGSAEPIGAVMSLTIHPMLGCSFRHAYAQRMVDSGSADLLFH